MHLWRECRFTCGVAASMRSNMGGNLSAQKRWSHYTCEFGPEAVNGRFMRTTDTVLNTKKVSGQRLITRCIWKGKKSSLKLPRGRVNFRYQNAKLLWKLLALANSDLEMTVRCGV